MWRDTPAQTLKYSEEFDQEDGFFQATPLARLAANLDVLRDLLDAPDAIVRRAYDVSLVAGATAYALGAARGDN